MKNRDIMIEHIKEMSGADEVIENEIKFGGLHGCNGFNCPDGHNPENCGGCPYEMFWEREDKEEDVKPCNTHFLKILPRWYQDIESGKKNFEIRRYDRPFEVGDILVLQEYERGRYTGRAIQKEIEYIYAGDGTYGLSQEFCILGIKDGKRIER